MVRAYARRAAHIDRMILACFVLGLSTRKVAIALLPILGRRISAGTVSKLAKTLDASVAAFHRRPLKDIYPVLMLDGVVLARKTGAGAIHRPVLVALGLRPDGKKEIIDYRLAVAESAAQWECFLTDLYMRGLRGDRLEMICVDGGSGLLAALPTVYPGIPVQRCWAHKIRNVLDKVRKTDQAALKAALHAVMNADNRPKARSAARRLADQWQEIYPKAVACLRNDLDELLSCWRYPTIEQRKKVRTTNAIERRFREVRRRTRPMGVFQDRTSMDRILFAVFTHENSNQGVPKAVARIAPEDETDAVLAQAVPVDRCRIEVSDTGVISGGHRIKRRFLLDDIVEVAEHVAAEAKNTDFDVGLSVLPLLVQIHRRTRPGFPRYRHVPNFRSQSSLALKPPTCQRQSRAWRRSTLHSSGLRKDLVHVEAASHRQACPVCDRAQHVPGYPR